MRALRWAVAVFVLAGLAFLAWALAGRWEELRALRHQVAGFPWRGAPLPLAASLAVAAGILLATAAIWVRLLRALGETLPYRRGVAVWNVASLGRYIPGKVWHLSGIAVLLKKEGRSGAAAVSSSVVAQVLTLLTGIAVGVGLAGTGLVDLPGGDLLEVALPVAALLLLVQPGVVRRVTRLAASRLGEEVAVEEFGAGELLRAGLALAGIWAGYGVAFWLFLRGLVGSPAPGLLSATGIFAASYVAGYLVIVSPGGLVAREGAMAALLASLGGLPAAVAAAVAVAARLWSTAAELAALGVALLVERWGRGGRSR